MSIKEKQDWYTRPEIFVANVAEGIDFYTKKLSFKIAWDYKEDEKVLVAQVYRGGKCEVILAEDANRSGMARLFIELLPEELSQLESEIEKNNIESRHSTWGMPVIEIKDPFGNELLFPIEQ